MPLRDLYGQDRAKRFLRRLYANRQIPHALLFTGLEGVGKAALALEFIKLLNCLHPDENDCCNVCSSCHKISAGNHPDVFWIKSEGASIRIDQIREIKARLQFRPFEGRWRAIVIQDAHELREEAGNALLKILEEPPDGNIFVLTASEPQSLLQTIVSRCCHLRLQPLEPVWIERYLRDVCKVDESYASSIAPLAEGSLKRAAHLADQQLQVRIREVLNRVTSLGELSMIEFFSLTAQWVQETQDLEQDLEWIKLWVRDQVLSQVLTDYHSLIGTDASVPGRIPKIQDDLLIGLYFELERAHQLIRQNVNKQLTLEGVCLSLKERFYGTSRRYSVS